MQSPFALDTQQEALAMWQFPHSKCSETVTIMVVVVVVLMAMMIVMMTAMLCSWLIAPLVNTVVQPLSKVSGLGVFMIVKNKGKLATPQRSC